ncbi:MAG: RHS repeat-associated core domain-containing protein [Hyphomonadaceae bacterium]
MTYRARAYAPSLGRFMQTDPISYAGGPNLYTYVANDPVNAIDPWGLREWVSANICAWQDGPGDGSGDIQVVGVRDFGMGGWLGGAVGNPNREFRLGRASDRVDALEVDDQPSQVAPNCIARDAEEPFLE